VLRVFRLDEIPQAFNVLKGDMSMVGPRPERPCFVGVLEQEIPFLQSPALPETGITGWAQVMCPIRSVRLGLLRKTAIRLLFTPSHKSFRCDAANYAEDDKGSVVGSRAVREPGFFGAW